MSSAALQRGIRDDRVCPVQHIAANRCQLAVSDFITPSLSISRLITRLLGKTIERLLAVQAWLNSRQPWQANVRLRGNVETHDLVNVAALRVVLVGVQPVRTFKLTYYRVSSLGRTRNFAISL